MKHNYTFLKKYLLFFVCVVLISLMGFSSHAQTYCYPTYSSGCASWGTTSVTIGSFTHSPTCGTTNYLTQTITLNAGVAYNATLISAGWCAVGISADFNTDGDFLDAGEILDTPGYIAQSTATYNMTLTIPATVPSGSYRMRIWNRGGNSGGAANYDACGAYGYGRYGDYTLIVLGAGSCNVPSLATSAITTNSATATITAPPIGNTPAGYIYELRLDNTAAGSGATGLASSGMQTGTAINLSNLYQGTPYKLFVRTFCSIGDSSSWNSVNFTTNMDTVVTVPLTNFNADVVANGIGGASSSTTNDVDGVSWALVSADFQTTSTSVLPANSIPLSRMFYNTIRKYKMNKYSTNNSLRLANSSTGTIKFLAPKRANRVYVMGVSGSGASTPIATIYFNDGTTQSATLYYPDWYTSGRNVATAVGRVHRLNNTLQTGPYLHDSAIVINSANRNKQIDSIGFSNTGNVMNILAVSVLENNLATCTTPKNLQASGISCTGATLTWTGNGTSANYQLSIGSSGFYANTGTIINVTGTSGANTYAFTNPGTQSAVQIYVRTACTGGAYSDWIGPVDLDFPTVTPTFTLPDSICSGSSGTTLAGTSTNGIMGSWTPSTVNTSTTTTYTFTPNTGQCANSLTHVINVKALVTPTFNPIGTVCQGTPAPALPSTSTNGISGSWNPSTVNTTTTTTYTFTPTSSGTSCANSTTMIIAVSSPSTSTESITICANQLPYTWHNKQVNSGGVGAAYDTLTNAGGCDSIVILTLNINPMVTPSVNLTASPSNTVSQGSTVSFTANITNGGTAPSIKWYKNGILISGATGTTWNAQAGVNFVDNDVISVKVTNLSTCSTVDSIIGSVTMHITNAVKSIARRPDFSLYPNPYQSTFHVKGLQIGDSFKIFDLLGKVVYSHQVEHSLTNPIELNDLPSATYLIMFMTSDGQSWSQTLTKE